MELPQKIASRPPAEGQAQPAAHFAEAGRNTRSRWRKTIGLELERAETIFVEADDRRAFAVDHNARSWRRSPLGTLRSRSSLLHLSKPPHPRRGCNQDERPQDCHCNHSPTEPLSAHDHARHDNRYDAIAGHHHPPISVETGGPVSYIAHHPPLEIQREARHRRIHRVSQQTIDSSFVRFHLSHRNILSLSACREEAGVPDADTISQCSQARLAVPPLHPRRSPANSKDATLIDRPREAPQYTRRELDFAAPFQPAGRVQVQEPRRHKEPLRSRVDF